MADYPDWPYLRVGRKLGRTIYGMESMEPSDDDVLLGIMDTPALAAMVVDAYNFFQSER